MSIWEPLSFDNLGTLSMCSYCGGILNPEVT